METSTILIIQILQISGKKSCWETSENRKILTVSESGAYFSTATILKLIDFQQLTVNQPSETFV